MKLTSKGGVRGVCTSPRSDSLNPRKRLDGSELDGSEHFEQNAKMSLELLGLLLELLLLLLYAFYHVLIRGREAPPYN